MSDRYQPIRPTIVTFAAMVMLAVAASAASAAIPLTQQLLRPNEIAGYRVVLGHETLKGVGALGEEIKSLCVKVESHDERSHAGFMAGEEESLGSRAGSHGGLAFSIVGQFASSRQASTFFRRDDQLCGSPTARQRHQAGITKLAMTRIPGAVGYRFSKLDFSWVMFARGRYVYAEGLLGGPPQARRFASGVEAFYARIRHRSQ